MTAVFFSGGPLDCQYRDMEHTPMEWRVPIRPPRSNCTFAEYFKDPHLPRKVEPVRRAVYRLHKTERGTFMYVYEREL
jgi:hypothetical protein